MAAFTLHCQHCGKEIEADEEWLGQTGTCPECGKPVEIRRPGAVAQPLPPLRPLPAEPPAAAPAPPPAPPVATRGLPRVPDLPGAARRPMPPAQSCGLATASLIMGILSLVLCGGVLALPAIICGHMARSRIRASRGTLGGDGMALAGLITGYVSLVFFVVFVGGMLAAIAVPSFVKAKETSERNFCINNLRMIDAAKEQRAMESAMDYGTEVAPEQLTDYLRGGAMPACPKGGTYTINPIGTDPECSEPGHALP